MWPGPERVYVGAGVDTDGQVLVFHDVLGLGSGRYPKFVRSYGELRAAAIDALARYASDVTAGRFPADAETYHMSADAEAALVASHGDG